MTVSEEDRVFFDELYQLWSKTTGAEHRYWMPVEYVDGTGRFKVYAVNPEDDSKKLIASELRDEDADFIASLHGTVPDLVRLLNEALDEADRADCDRDERECRIAELEIELAEMRDLAQKWGAPV